MAHETVGQPSRHRGRPRPRLWLWEVWGENRPIIKAITADFLLFLVFVALLEIGHVVIKLTTIEQGKKETLEGAHFYLLTAGWVILGVGLLLELMKILLGKLKH